MYTTVLMGVTVGRNRQPTAICVAELEENDHPPHSVVDHFVIRHLERLEIGTPVPAVAQRLAAISAKIRKRNRGDWPTLYVDATGYGEPLIDLFRDETTNLHSIRAVHFNHGDQRTEEGGIIRLGKAYLVSRLQILLQAGNLHLPRSVEAEQLATELLEYEVQIETDANERYGAFSVGIRDDLVTALGLAVHKKPKRVRGSLFS